MTTPANPSNPKPAESANAVLVDVIPFEDKVNAFWAKNKTVVYIACALVLAGIVGKGAMDYMERQKELEIEKAYAAAANTEQLKSFIAGHSDHSLAGVAHARIGDEAYAASKFTDAAAAYDKAAALLKTGPLATRVKIGGALAKVQGGQAAAGLAELKQVKDDASQFKAARAEAAYHLASVAVDAGDLTGANTLIDEILKIDPTGPWMQRGMMLRMVMPPASAPIVPATMAPAAPAAPAASAPASGDAIKIPGK